MLYAEHCLRGATVPASAMRSCPQHRGPARTLEVLSPDQLCMVRCDLLEDATDQVRQREEELRLGLCTRDCEERLRFKAMTREVLDGQNKAGQKGTAHRQPSFLCKGITVAQAQAATCISQLLQLLKQHGVVHRTLSAVDQALAMRIGDLAAHWPGFSAHSHSRFNYFLDLPPLTSRSAAASFLSGPADPPLRSSFAKKWTPPKPEDMVKTPKLQPKVKVRLLFQSPEIYATDVGEEKQGVGSVYGCRKPDKNGKGEKSLMHPEITFNTLPPIFGGIKKVHVHLEDQTTGIVYWDADFKLPMLDPLVNLAGKTRLKKFAQPENLADSFYKPCVAKDDMQKHDFVLSVRSIGKYWDEDLQEFRPNTGFQRGRMPEAHIGFEVQRLPVIVDGKEQLGNWRRPGDSYAFGGAVVQDPFLRSLRGEEDPFYDTKAGKTNRGYYDYIITKKGRAMDTFGYLTKYGPNPLLADPPGWESFEAAAK